MNAPRGNRSIGISFHAGVLGRKCRNNRPGRLLLMVVQALICYEFVDPFDRSFGRQSLHGRFNCWNNLRLGTLCHRLSKPVKLSLGVHCAVRVASAIVRRPDSSKLIDMDRSVQNAVQSDLGVPVDARLGRQWGVGITSLAFIALQSACSFVIAVSGARVLIGLGALTAVTLGAEAPPSGLHRDAIRIPMMILAVAGSLINLYVIWRIRSLRRRPSAQWRQQPISRRRIWGENMQLALAVLTLVLVAAEFFSHLYIFRIVR